MSERKDIDSISIFWNTFLSEFRRMLTNRHLLVVCFLAPFFYVIVLTSVYQQKRIMDVPVGIVDADNTSMTREAARYLDSSEGLSVYAKYDEIHSAQDALTRGDIYGYFYFPKGFTADIKKGGSANYRVAADYMNIALANPIFLGSSDVAGEMNAVKFSQLPGKARLSRERAAAMRNLVRPEVHTIFNREMNYLDFFVPGLVAVIMQQIIIVALCLCGAEDRQLGIAGNYYRNAGSNPFIAAGARFLPCLIVNYVLTCIFLLLWLRTLDLRIVHSLPDTMLYIFVFTAACCSFGLMISPFFRKTADVFMFLMYFSMAAFLVSGYSWPAYMLPLPHRLIGMPIPTTYFMSWIRRAFGAGLPPSWTMPDFWILFAMAITYFLLATLFYKRIYGREK